MKFTLKKALFKGTYIKTHVKITKNYMQS